MKKNLLTVLLSLYMILAFAQLNTGIHTSAWGGVSNVNWNPAVADPKYKVDVSLGTMNTGFAQNHLSFTDPETMFTNSWFQEIFGVNLLNNEQWTAGLYNAKGNTGKLRQINQWAVLEGPGSFLLPFGKNKNAFAFSYHLNAARTINGLSSASGNHISGLAGGTNASASLQMNNAAWLDYSLTYSRVLLDEGPHFVKGGLTFKIIHALETASVSSDDYGFDGTSVAGTFNTSYNNTAAISAGGDLGFVYEWRPKKASFLYQMNGDSATVPRFRNVYTLAFGFSVIDLGVLPMGKSASQKRVTYSSSDFTLFDAKSLTNNLFQMAGSTYTGSTSMFLPTRFNVYLDYNIGKGFGLNLNSSISPYFNKEKAQITYGSSISLVPRFDMPMVGVYLPISYNFSGNPGLGFAMRAGPVFLGISDFIGMATGMGASNIYGGIKIPIYYHSLSDKDKDKVSDKFDLCPGVKGPWPAQGCPDKDSDGVRDEKDACPDVAGSAAFNGCPDRDADGISDMNDECPDNAGTAQFKGCPDTDGDGIRDKDDDCPNEKGPVASKGCPDRDGDGVPDKDDKCRTQKGSPEHAGCPDTDGDGVYDHEDDDIEVPGPVENRGAPWQDSDGDGIFDNEDSCKIIPGKKEFHGCPTPPRPSIVRELTSVYDTLYFEANNFMISARNEAILRKFATKMLTDEQKDNTVLLMGYTDDNETPPAYRSRLSQNRANAVRNKLLDFNVNGKRIEFFGAGDEDPFGDNSKESGRRLNRRVIIYIKIIPN